MSVAPATNAPELELAAVEHGAALDAAAGQAADEELRQGGGVRGSTDDLGGVRGATADEAAAGEAAADLKGACETSALVCSGVLGAGTGRFFGNGVVGSRGLSTSGGVAGAGMPGAGIRQRLKRFSGGHAASGGVWGAGALKGSGGHAASGAVRGSSSHWRHWPQLRLMALSRLPSAPRMGHGGAQHKFRSALIVQCTMMLRAIR